MSTAVPRRHDRRPVDWKKFLSDLEQLNWYALILEASEPRGLLKEVMSDPRVAARPDMLVLELSECQRTFRRLREWIEALGRDSSRRSR